jgi:hypothetical protein
MTVNDLLWLALAAAALAGVCGGLWVDWKLNWGRKRQPPGFDVIPPDPTDRANEP